MPNLSDLSKRTTNSLETDYKAEVVAASLIELGIDPDSATIIRKCIARRETSTKVENVYQKYSELDADRHVAASLGCALFHVA